MSDGKTIAEFWERYNLTCLPDDLPLDRRQALRQAFYGGAGSIIDVLCNVIIMPGRTEPTAAENRDSFAAFDTVIAELKDYQEQTTGKRRDWP